MSLAAETPYNPTAAQRHSRSTLGLAQRNGRTRVYLMDLWSFIPYYMARLCESLQEESVDVELGSVRYHLDRNYFCRHGLYPDSALLDWGGRFQHPLVRRFVKSCEYVANLLGLSARFCASRRRIIHVQFLPLVDRGLPFEIWFLRLCLWLGVRMVCTVHNFPDRDASRNLKFYERIYGMADALICHGAEAKSRLISEFKVPTERIWIIPHGPLFDNKPEISVLEARAELGLPCAETIVLCFGVINDYKGIPFLIDSWRLLIASGAKARLIIAGTGAADLLADIRQKVINLGLESCIDLELRFISVEELPLWHLAADILVYPYKGGTTSGALLTGMNYGKAIVATRLPFFIEHLRDGENAALIDYSDAESLARTMGRLINDKAERSKLAQGVRAMRTGCSSWMEIARATRTCYERVLEMPSRRSENLTEARSATRGHDVTAQ
jgi:glycosyltransferase involved in cell wall biosynthesis